MTFAAALVIGLVGGALRRSLVRIALLFVWTAVLAFQTWFVGSGHAGGDARTVYRPGYWLFQLVFVGVGASVWALTTTLVARRREARRA